MKRNETPEYREAHGLKPIPKTPPWDISQKGNGNFRRSTNWPPEKQLDFGKKKNRAGVMARFFAKLGFVIPAKQRARWEQRKRAKSARLARRVNRQGRK